MLPNCRCLSRSTKSKCCHLRNVKNLVITRNKILALNKIADTVFWDLQFILSPIQVSKFIEYFNQAKSTMKVLSPCKMWNLPKQPSEDMETDAMQPDDLDQDLPENCYFTESEDEVEQEEFTGINIPEKID